MKKIIEWLKPLVRNYYLMTALFFVVWMIFFDSNNVISQIRHRRELSELERERDYFVSEIARNKALVEQLTNPRDLKPIEKYAREHYLMKRENEEVFLIVQKEKE